MIKKLIATLALSSVLLVGCAGNSAADEKETKDSIESESAEIVESEEKEDTPLPKWTPTISFITTIDSADVLFDRRNDELDDNMEMMSDLSNQTANVIEKNDRFTDKNGTENIVEPILQTYQYTNELEMVGSYEIDVDDVNISVLSQKSEYGQSVKDKILQKSTTPDGKEMMENTAVKIVFENENYFVIAMSNAFSDESTPEAKYFTDLFTSDELVSVYEKHLN